MDCLRNGNEEKNLFSNTKAKFSIIQLQVSPQPYFYTSFYHQKISQLL